ncbi:MAG: serine hydrolase domain-containing protein [Acidobacteriota bacterium]
MQIIVTDLFPKVLFTALFTVVFALVASAQTAADVDAVVQKMIDAKAIPGAGIAVVREGKVVLAKGYGAADVEAGKPVNEKTAFQIASVTKQFTAAGILLLAEDGKLELDDTFGKYVPDVPAKWRGITIRQLLNQVSGIPNYTAVGKLVIEKPYTKTEILDLVKDLPLVFEPGTKWAYSNTNYFLLGMVIEKASGRSYPQFMNDRIFKPLGMTSTFVNTSGSKIRNATAGYDHAAGKWEKAKLVDPSQPFAAGAIVSTPADMGKWAVAIGQGKLLKKASWDEAFASGTLADGKRTGYGFGWRSGKVGETAFIGHSGGIEGFGSFIVRFPVEDLSVVVLANTASGSSELLAFDIAGVFLPKVAAFQAAQSEAKNVAAIADADPKTTKYLRGVFDAMVRGEGDPANFSAEMQKFMFPDNIKQLKGPLGSQGPIRSFDLLTAENADGSKRRVYRVTFESGMKVRATFGIDIQGKITGANVRPE